MTQSDLNDILDDHKKWLNGEGGEHADLRHADLRRADLRRADLRDAYLRGADLSGAEGLVSASEYLEEHFECTSDGLVCYKTFGQHYESPEYWDIEEGAVLEEVVNPSRTVDCACGVNVATREWIGDVGDVWKCLVRWKDMADVVVPYHTDGKIRAGRVKLLEKL